MTTLARRLAADLGITAAQTEATIRLIDDGNTVPFIARYRKEATGGLDDTQLRRLDERLSYLRELDERRETIRKAIAETGKLTPELELALAQADSKARLEDLYLPYRSKRRTKAQIAREAGLEPLARTLLEQPGQDPQQAAAAYVSADRGIADGKAALDGARQILMEQMAEDADLLDSLREELWRTGLLQSSVAEGMEQSGAKFSDYFDASERLAAIPSHRALAMFRGRNENILHLKLQPADPAPQPPALSLAEQKIAARFGIALRNRPADGWLCETVRWAWKIKLLPHLETALLARLRDAAEAEAIAVFSRNLSSLLLAAPAGHRPTIGLDPGLRTGVKLAVIDGTGKVVDTATIYPHPPRNDWEGSLAVLAALAARHKVEVLAIGNGTASRETDRLCADLLRRVPQLGLIKVMVSEAGASVYSASELAAQEFPDLDVTLRGAVSIARRLQDPLAELVKIDPKSIGVGQYQHDVDQGTLGRSLDAVVEDCVNGVGVDVNTASPALLSRVAGLSSGLARNIVSFRNANGPFRARTDLRKVERLGPKAFEQAAGFLRIPQAANPLDGSSVHPEAYPLAERIASAAGLPLSDLIGNAPVLRRLKPEQFADARFGLPTVSDILRELEKPGRDPRGDFQTASFQDGVETLADLRLEMVLEGVVTNVTNFGAFVDIGVHQDGLVHVSALSHSFVKDPHAVVKAGDVVKVKVISLDLPRKRIALTMRLDDKAEKAEKPASSSGGNRNSGTRPPAGRAAGKPAATPAPRSAAAPASDNAFAAAFAKARSGR